MRRRCVLILGLLIVMVATLGYAQRGAPQQARVGVSPVPLWPPDGYIPPELSDRYVFYDVNAEEYVIRYPENLGTPEFAANPGQMKMHRIASNRGSQPLIAFAVGQAQGGLRYTYRVTNGERAKKAITAWDLVMPSAPDGELTVPANWRGAAMRSSVSSVGNALGVPGVSGVLLSYYYMDDSAPIAAGRTLDFGVVSRLKPGMSMGYVRGGLIETPPAELPEAVTAQLGRVLSVAFNRENVLIVAPKFPADTPRERIAEDFQSGIIRMIAAGQLTESPAIREAQSRLTLYTQDVEAYRDTPLSLSQKPGNAYEAAFLQALLLAMN